MGLGIGTVHCWLRLAAAVWELSCTVLFLFAGWEQIVGPKFIGFAGINKDYEYSPAKMVCLYGTVPYCQYVCTSSTIISTSRTIISTLQPASTATIPRTHRSHRTVPTVTVCLRYSYRYGTSTVLVLGGIYQSTGTRTRANSS